MKFIFLSITLFVISIVTAQNTLISTGSYFEGEPYLVINPQNQQHIVAAWMGYQLNNKMVIKSSVSINGGLNWSAPIWQAHVSSGFSSADVSLAFDNSGNVFMSYIDFDNDTYLDGRVLVRKSTDGGLSWGSPIEAISIQDCPGKLCIDRPWMVVDRSGGTSDGVIYITTMNANQPTMVSAPYNPYLSVSTDGGLSFFNPRFVDSTGYLAGSTINQPMSSPTITSNGKFYAAYPSYLSSQNVFPRLILASSTDAGVTISHQVAYQGTNFGVNNSLLKSGYLLISNPSNANHLAFFFLSDSNGDADIMMTETNNAGVSWSSFQRINQDPLANGKLQDLVWADFDNDGDLVVCWRDRRNASGNTYQVPTEIYCAVRKNNSSTFGTDYVISSLQAPHDVVLEDKGNDFMHVALENDTAYGIWGDVRSGKLKIYLNKWNINTQVSSVHEIYSQKETFAYPNPSSQLINFPNSILNSEFYLFTLEGKLIERGTINQLTYNCEHLTTGHYYFKIVNNSDVSVLKFDVFK